MGKEEEEQVEEEEKRNWGLSVETREDKVMDGKIMKIKRYDKDKKMNKDK